MYKLKTETDGGLSRASSSYLGTILHHYVLWVSCSHTKQSTWGTLCVWVRLECVALCLIPPLPPLPGIRIPLPHFWIKFVWAESWIELSTNLNVHSFSPSIIILHQHCTTSLTNLCVCDYIHSFLTLWLIVSQATPSACCLIHPSVTGV